MKAQIERLEKPVSKSANTQLLRIIPENVNLAAIKSCIDIPAPPSSALPPRVASNSYTYYKIDGNGNISKVAFQRQPLAAVTDLMWEPGEIIKCGFDITGANINIIDKVKLYAREWEKIANIKFDFVTDINNAVIKIGFAKGGSYSMIGRNALTNTAKTNTMNFGWLTTASDAECRRVVLHEFGHALGFIHEHQSPGAGIPWNRENVYAYYAQPPNNWDKTMVDQNVFTKYAYSMTNYSRYDRLSIMQYPVPAELLTDGSSIPFNTDFSATDKQYAALVYPFPALPPNAYGTLRTGDDCDEIDFAVEYGVVDKEKIEFIINLGTKDNKAVTWWKQIGIPLTNNTENVLWIQNHSLIPSENKTTASLQIPASLIKTTQGISFWKAKLLGVHTKLGYTWNVLPAVRGGCRIRLTWKKDTCN